MVNGYLRAAQHAELFAGSLPRRRPFLPPAPHVKLTLRVCLDEIFLVGTASAARAPPRLGRAGGGVLEDANKYLPALGE
jgi:hypothetical protein